MSAEHLSGAATREPSQPLTSASIGWFMNVIATVGIGPHVPETSSDTISWAPFHGGQLSAVSVAHPATSSPKAQAIRMAEVWIAAGRHTITPADVLHVTICA